MEARSGECRPGNGGGGIATIRTTGISTPATHIADKTTREWIYAWLEDPASYSATATMPNFKLSNDDARDVSAFLIAASTSFPGDTIKSVSSGPAPDPAAAASLYGQSFCASCHAAQNAAGRLVGGDLGPELTGAGTKAKPKWMEAWLNNPRSYDPGTTMPHYRWTAPQLKLIASFIENKTNPDFVANVHLEPAAEAQVAHGKKLVSDYGCAACHEIAGIRKPENFAPELSRVGSKPVVQLVFLPGMKHTLPDYLSAKVRQSRDFGQNLRMPQYELSPEQIDDVTTALLSLTDRSFTLPSSLQIAATHDSDYQPAGQAGKLMEDIASKSLLDPNGPKFLLGRKWVPR
jgi:mono/diheme cytochrome c family protein